MTFSIYSTVSYLGILVCVGVYVHELFYMAVCMCVYDSVPSVNTRAHDKGDVWDSITRVLERTTETSPLCHCSGTCGQHSSPLANRRPKPLDTRGPAGN